jgi:hypothetical protein
MTLMPDQLLFCGVKLTPRLKAGLAQAPQTLKDQFIGNPSGDLLVVSYLQEDYLGKPVGAKSDYTSLELVESHIHSVLKKLMPDFDYRQHPAVLLTVEKRDYVDA